MPTLEKLEQTASKLLFELFGDEFEENEVEVFVPGDEGKPSPDTTKGLKENLKKRIMESKVPKAPVAPTKKSLQSEMLHFEKTGQRGESLEKLFTVLKNIAPTSVSCEQAFSVASSFLPKRRSCLSDQSIDDLCFEKAYFDNNGYE